MEAIKTVGLTKKYKDICAVDSLSLEIFKGEIFSLLGVNGAGKTTTVKMLSCLLTPSSGDAFIFGKSIVSNANDVKRIISVSPQETAVAPNLTVLENLQMMAGLYGFERKKIKKKINELIDIFGLGEYARKRAGKLSGGYQRKLSIAMALISEPLILFLDEPTLGLDVIARRELWELIKAIKQKTTVILTTHYMEEAESLSDRIGIMKDGVLLTVGTTEEIKARGKSENFEESFINIVKGGEK